MLLAAYPEKMDATAWVMAVTTCLKWITMGAASGLFVYGLAAAPVRYICGKQNTSRKRYALEGHHSFHGFFEGLKLLQANSTASSVLPISCRDMRRIFS